MLKSASTCSTQVFKAMEPDASLALRTPWTGSHMTIDSKRSEQCKRRLLATESAEGDHDIKLSVFIKMQLR